MSRDSLHDHYDQPDLTQSILAALRDAGCDLEHLTAADLANLDEFHIRGRAATVELARLAALQPGQTVLDLGCGIGGPARRLATEYGCRVTGLDLIPSYCEAASELTRRLGLADRVDFQQGDLRKMPFPAASFDRVWSQHTVMNVADKAALATEVRRVLKPGGKAVFYEICAGNGEPIELPVPWASAPEQSHLVSPDALRAELSAAGLCEDIWDDVSAASLAWIDELAAGPKPETGGRRPGLGLLMGPNARQKSGNLARNLREGRIVVVRAVFSG